MATAPRKGLNRARKLGSADDIGGISQYTIASGYATALGVGDLVKLSGTADNIEVGTNAAYNLGVFLSCTYLDPNTGYERIIDYWPAGQTSPNQTVTALVVDDPNATFKVICDNPLGDMKVGQFYALTLAAPDANTHRSQMTLNNVVTETGTGSVTTILSGLAAGNHTFNISTSVNTTPVTITMTSTTTETQLLAALNAVPGIKASVNASDYLVVSTTDGGNMILADGTATPLASTGLLVAAGTYTAYVAKSAAAVKIIQLTDTTNQVVEVCLVNHELQANR